jgi:hypothetical protein
MGGRSVSVRVVCPRSSRHHIAHICNINATRTRCLALHGPCRHPVSRKGERGAAKGRCVVCGVGVRGACCTWCAIALPSLHCMLARRAVCVRPRESTAERSAADSSGGGDVRCPPSLPPSLSPFSYSSGGATRSAAAPSGAALSHAVHAARVRQRTAAVRGPCLATQRACRVGVRATHTRGCSLLRRREVGCQGFRHGGASHCVCVETGGPGCVSHAALSPAPGGLASTGIRLWCRSRS